MTDEDATSTPRKSDADQVPLVNRDAPILMFDAVETFGPADGGANMTLVALRHVYDGGTVQKERVVVAYLRMGPGGFASLQEAVRQIPLLAAPPATSTAN
jgi:hypothetical protein